MTVPDLAAAAPRLPRLVGGFDAPARSSFRGLTLLRVSLAALLIGQLGRVPVLSADVKDAPILFNDLFVLLILCSCVLTAIQARRLRADETVWLALAFAGIGGVSALLAVPRFGLSAYELVYSLAYLARWLAYFGIYIAAINWLTYDTAHRMWKSVEAAVLVFASFGIIQTIFMPGFAQLVYPDSRIALDWDFQGRRLVSTFLAPNFAGVLIAMVLAVQLAQMAAGHRVELWKLVILGSGLILTVSRSSVLALLAAMAFMAIAWGISRRVMRLAVAISLLMVPLLPWAITYAASMNKFTIDASAMARVVSWLAALEMLEDNPVIGVGFNTVGFAQRAYGREMVGASAFGFDGGLLFIAVMTGFLGLSVFLLLLFRTMARCARVWRDSARSGQDRGLALGVAAATVALVVHSLFVNSIVYPFLLHVLWILWGAVAVIARSPSPGPARVSQPEEPPRRRLLTVQGT